MEYALEKKVEEYIKSDSFSKNEILNEKQKSVVTKKVIEGLNYVEISKTLMLSSVQIKNIFLKSIKLISLYLNGKSPSLLIKDSLLSARIKNSLSENEEIKCLKDLHNLEIHKLIRRNMGITSILEIQKYIEDIGLSLKFPNEKCFHRLDSQFRKDLFTHFTDNDLIHWIYKISELLKEKQR